MDVFTRILENILIITSCLRGDSFAFAFMSPVVDELGAFHLLILIIQNTTLVLTK